MHNSLSIQANRKILVFDCDVIITSQTLNYDTCPLVKISHAKFHVCTPSIFRRANTDRNTSRFLLFSIDYCTTIIYFC